MSVNINMRTCEYIRTYTLYLLVFNKRNKRNKNKRGKKKEIMCMYAYVRACTVLTCI